MSLPAIPDSLLAPLVQAAVDVLRALTPQEAPPSLRPLLGFDRRGFSSSTARAQLLRVLADDEGFAARVAEAFADHPETKAVLAEWAPDRALEAADEAAARDDLAVLASALYAARPDGWELGLGVILTVDARRRERRAEDDDRKAFDTRVASAEEAARRSEAARSQAATRIGELEDELREERRARRARDDEAERDAEAERQRIGELEREVMVLRGEIGSVQQRAEEEAERAADAVEARRQAEMTRRDTEAALRDAEAARRAAEDELVALRSSPDPAPALAPSPAPSVDARALAKAAEVARALADRLDVIAERAGDGTEAAPEVPAPAPPVPGAPVAPAPEDPPVSPARSDRPTTTVAPTAASPPTRRVRPPVPPGMVGTSSHGLWAVLASGQVRVVVDGYNVSMLAWGDERPDTQRQRLCALLERLHLRTRAPVTVVFDGADVEGVRPPQRPGVRVVFSPPDQDADHVVVAEVAALPRQVPVVVVSSDGWVRDHAEDEGALVASSDVFLQILRR